MKQIVVIEGELNLLSVLDGEMALNTLIDGEMDKVIFVETTPTPHYHGATEFIPTGSSPGQFFNGSYELTYIY